MDGPRWRRTAEVLSKTNSKISRDKSFADDLNKERGIVRSRVALLLCQEKALEMLSNDAHIGVKN